MKRRFGHPSTKRLRRWLEGQEPDLDRHIADCHRCATVLEDLAEPLPAMASALRETLAAPEDLQPRLRAGITRKLQAQDELRLLVEMMGLAWQTGRLLSSPPPQDG